MLFSKCLVSFRVFLGVLGKKKKKTKNGVPKNQNGGSVGIGFAGILTPKNPTLA